MAYNSDNHEKKVAFVMEKYREWKQRKEDIPDTRFVKSVLPTLGLPMSYTGFMNGYKHRHRQKREDDAQLSLF
jgi:hypothetical protein